MSADPQEAVEFVRQVMDADSENRQLGLTDLKFRFGEQWPQYAIVSRGLERPQLTVNEMDSYIRQVTNQQRQQRPRGKAQPVDSLADPKIAKVITGLGRHIEVNSNADHAYDTAFEFAATIGWGYWRLRADYIADDSFNQDLFIDCIDNPFSVYFDPQSRLPDGSDAGKVVLADDMDKKLFEQEHPGAATTGFSERGTGDSDPDWFTEHTIRVAEYFFVERLKAKLVMLSDGTALWADGMPPEEILKKAGISIRGDRESIKRTVRWRKQTAMDILDEKKLPGKWIPVVPVYWTNIIIDGKRMKQGLVRPGTDPQRMVNFWNTAATEALALAPKAKWAGAEGFDEGHENEWRAANISSNPVLHYKTTGVDGREIPAPERVQPEPPPAGFLEAIGLSNQNLQRVMGMFDPATRSQNDKSGRAIIAERSQSENSNYHGYDNLTRSIKHTWAIMLSWIPTYFDTTRVQRIIGEDGTSDLVTLNERKVTEGQAIAQVLNDVTIGTYGVVMETGPGYDTKRIEGVATMLQLMGTPIGEKVAAVGADLLVRQMDMPQSDVLADRLAASEPMSQIDEQSDIPPAAQMQMKAQAQKLQQAVQMIQQLQQELKFKTGIEQMRQSGETQREHLRMVTKAHDVEKRDATTQHDVNMRANTAMSVEEIKGHIALLLARIDERSEDKARADADQAAIQ